MASYVDDYSYLNMYTIRERARERIFHNIIEGSQRGRRGRTLMLRYDDIFEILWIYV
jgi:hypothetical protein